MGTITHFLCEDIGRIVFTFNELDGERLVLYPFTDGVFFQFHVPNVLTSDIVRPLDTCLIIVEHVSCFKVIGDRVAVTSEICKCETNAHGGFSTFVSSTYFRFT